MEEKASEDVEEVEENAEVAFSGGEPPENSEGEVLSSRKDGKEDQNQDRWLIWCAEGTGNAKPPVSAGDCSDVFPNITQESRISPTLLSMRPQTHTPISTV